MVSDQDAFPVGGVAAPSADTGVISPGGMGFDINCGMRLLRTALSEDDVRPRLQVFARILGKDARALGLFVVYDVCTTRRR